MPGALRAVDVNSNERGLVTFGMQMLNYTETRDRNYKLIEGKKAALHFPITPNLMSSATETIPLWYFDEVKGMD
ncbi:MAG: hypothetical protein IPM92_17190 [Saprospiraceae bacterium]|nr:hypothetical protein [Saprospiraceae bacterium]